MDKIDYQILNILKSNGRASHEAIAKAVSLSRPAVRNRIISMEEEGIISGYSTNINYNKLGYHIHVLIYMKLNNTTYKHTMAQLDSVKVPDIIRYSCYRISGEWCLLLKVMSKTQEGLTKYLDSLLDLDGVIATNTVFLFKS